MQLPAPILLSAQQALPCQILAHAVAHNPGRARPRRESIIHVGTHVAAFPAQQCHIRQQPQAPACPDPVPLHGRDHRQFTVQRHFKDPGIRELSLPGLDGQQAFLASSTGKVAVIAGQHHYLVRRRLLDMGEDFSDPFHQGFGEHVSGLSVFHPDHHNAFWMSGSGDHPGMQGNGCRCNRQPHRSLIFFLFCSVLFCSVFFLIPSSHCRQAANLLLQGCSRVVLPGSQDGPGQPGPERGHPQGRRQHLIALHHQQRPHPLLQISSRILTSSQQDFPTCTVAEAVGEQRHCRLRQHRILAWLQTCRSIPPRLAVHTGIATLVQQPGWAPGIPLHGSDDGSRRFQQQAL